MFENDNGNGFFAGNDLDLGSAANDFGGFTPIDSAEADAIFGGSTAPEASAPQKTAEENNAASVQQRAPDDNQGQTVAPVQNGNAEKVEEPNNEKVTENAGGQPEAVAGTNSPEPAEVPNLFEAAVAKASQICFLVVV